MTKFTQIQPSILTQCFYKSTELNYRINQHVPKENIYHYIPEFLENETGMFRIDLRGGGKYLPVIYSFEVGFNPKIPELVAALRDLVFGHSIPNEIN